MATYTDIPEELNPKVLKLRTSEGISAINAQWPACEKWFKDNLSNTVLFREMERVVSKYQFKSEKDQWAWLNFKKHMIDALCASKAEDNSTKANLDDDAVCDIYTAIVFFKLFFGDVGPVERNQDFVLFFDPVKRLLKELEEDK